MKLIKRLELRVSRVRIPELEGRAFTSAADVARLSFALIGEQDCESFLAFPLDVKNRPIGYAEVARGGVEQCPVNARDVFRLAILAGATSIIVAHNHPSDDTTPSEADNAITVRLHKAGVLLGITMLDHVIVGATVGNYYSYAAVSRFDELAKDARDVPLDG